MLYQTAGTSVGENIREHIEGVIVGMCALHHVKSHGESIGRHVALYRQAAFFLLCRLLRQISGTYVSLRNRTEPFFRQTDGLFQRDVARHSKYGVIWRVKAEKEILYLIQSSLCDVRNVFADGTPLIGVNTIGEFANQCAHITVWLVEIALLEFFRHDLALHLQISRSESET